ncbi:MAG: trypsin-like peptidase domain-containing protein [Pirellulales bacterium]|nr:trypsin-like peptidase domain-containing protein [Pirellulales bacterium]
MAGSRRIGAPILIVFFCLICGHAWASVRAQDPEPEFDSAARERRFQELARAADEFERQGHLLRTVVKLIAPTVVHIETEKTEGARGTTRRLVEEAGSGVVIQLKERFYVLTNYHVIKGTELGNIQISLADGRQISPTKAWDDPPTDIAVMAVQSSRLVPARIGDSARVDIGDFVVAVGSPFGLSHSVTYGIVSAKGRRDLELDSEGVQYGDFLQTDAAINPGNSGGPLINLRGEVIGINTAIASNSGGNEGIGFSIPINDVMKVVRQLVDQGIVTRAFLGVQLDRHFGPAKATAIGLARPRGALINGITAGSPAEKGGLRVGDVVLRFNNLPVDDDSHLINLVALADVTGTTPVVVFRGGQEETLNIQLVDRKRFSRPE